eukprot:GILK01005024.1.p1 GENE.GILK01005024.1~~GILK01005024.1.p1  ORF type:complete len:1174 (-),score=231.08 GILK01005024.1:215-3736(-)
MLVQSKEKRKKKKEPVEKKAEDRTIYANSPQQNAAFKFPNNAISTSKYSILTFLPKNLYQQFRKLANVYFLIIAVLQTVPSISISYGQPVILVPLLFVICVSAVKDALEDLVRHRSDYEENHRRVMVFRNGRVRELLWRQVLVGDVIKVVSNQAFPADLILLSSSEPKGICYVETANLDGETNLKHKMAARETAHLIPEDDAASKFTATLVCEGPNDRLYHFKGNMTLGHGGQVSLDANQMLLRGSALKNTQWVYGVVIYTGHESKIMKNSTQSRAKQSTVERLMNRQIIYVFLLQMILCLFGGIYNGIWLEEHTRTAGYLHLEEYNFFSAVVIRTFTWMLIFTNFVPISLVVSLETVKYCQACFIAWDEKIYDPITDTATAAQSSNLNEELGQVEYIFSDKTGTLTCNKMEFRKCSVGGESYGRGTTEIGRARIAREQGRALNEMDEDDSRANVKNVSPIFHEPVGNVNFDDTYMFDHMLDPHHPNCQNLRNFFMHLAVCHTIIPEKDKNTGEIVYQASSPDELALVNGARFAGFYFHTRTENGVVVNMMGEDVSFEILNVLEFNSDRKRMSVIARGSDGQYVLYTKGADTTVFPLLRTADKDLLTTTQKHLEIFADEGLRTLVIAVKFLDPEVYREWNERFQEAKRAIEGREEKVDAVSAEIEQDLTLLGSTAIEDRLQDQVPQTIATLAQAGLKIWMLTGDKVETAINIGFACSLLEQHMRRMLIQSVSPPEVRTDLQEALDSIKDIKSKERDPVFALVITGDALFHALSADMRYVLLELAQQCKAVIACRVSPKQKAEVVRLVKNNIACVTLAIGDGANDVNMISAAHVGIGISGQEGLQATRAADYAIAQFSFLRRLLLVHGREAYRRNSKLVCYTFYKNITFVAPMFYFGVFSAFSGQPFYNAWVYQLYNILYTAMPIVIYSIFDRDIEYKTLESTPKLYEPGLQGALFNTKVFWQYVSNGFWHAAVILAVPMMAYARVSTRPDGQMEDLWLLGSVIYAAVVIICNLKLALEMNAWTNIAFIVMFVSVSSYFVTMTIFAGVAVKLDIYGVMAHLWTSPAFYFCMLLLPVVALMRDFVWKAYSRFFHADVKHVIQESQYLARKRKFVSEQPFLDTESYLEKYNYKKDPSKSTIWNSFAAEQDKHTGFAFSQEPGQTPQITDEQYYKNL